MRRASGRTAAIVVAIVVVALSMTVAATSAATGRQADKTTFIYGAEGGITTLDWGQPFQGIPMRDVGFELGGMLYTWDVSKLRGNGCSQLPGVNDIRPDLAESAKWDAGTSSYIFTLRDTKSENGNPLTSEDVRFTFEHLIAARQAVANLLWNTVASYGFTPGDITTNPIQPIGKRTFRLKVKTKTVFDLTVLHWMHFRILDSVEVKKHATAADPYASAWLTTHNPGFGPWKVSGFAPGSAVFLTRNPNYWGPRGNLKKMIIKAIPDASTRRQLLAAGQLDYAARLSLSDYIALTQKGPSSGVVVQRCFSADRTTLVLNFRDKTLANPKVRQAISLAIDRPELNKGGYLGQFVPARYGVGTVYPFKKTAAGTFPPVDVNKAKALLADAGFPNGFNMTMIINSGQPGPEAESLAVLMKSQLAKIGIDVKIQLIATTTDFRSTFAAGNYQALLYSEVPAIADPFYSLNLLNTTASFQNSFKYNNAEYDRLVGEIRVTPPGAARDARVTKLAEIVVATVPSVYITDSVFLHAVRVGFKGWIHPPSGAIHAYLLTATK